MKNKNICKSLHNMMQDEAGSLGQITITAPAGCTLQIIAQV